MADPVEIVVERLGLQGDGLAGVALIAGGGQLAGRGSVPIYVAAAEYNRIFAADKLRALTDAATAAGGEARFDYFEDESHVSIVPSALPAAIDWPTITWSQATILPCASRPISARCRWDGR